MAPTLALEALAVYDHTLNQTGETLLVEDGNARPIRGGPPSYASRLRLGGCIIPSFIDAHLHLTWLGLHLKGVDLSGSKTPSDVAHGMIHAKGEIAYGRGWDQENFDDPRELPTRRMLDKYVRDRPAIAVRVCGHLAVANTAALQMAEPWKKYPGLVDRGNGILWEDAVEYTLSRILEEIDLKPYLATALNALWEAGVSGFSSMSCSPMEYKALRRLEDEGTLRHRVSCYPDHHRLREFPADSSRNIGMVRIVGVKLFADGSFGARTAALHDDYADDPGNKGRLLLTSRDIERIGKEVLSRGLRVATHAIGDEAIGEVLDAYENLGIEDKGRIEHFSLAGDHEISRAARLGVYVVVQPYFRIADWWLEKRLGSERTRLAYRFRRMISKGVRIAFSTDSPVDPYDPIETLWASYSRCNTPLCNNEEALSPSEAFYAYTLSAAHASGGPVVELVNREEGWGDILSYSWTPSDPLSTSWRGPVTLLDTILER